MGNFSAKVDKFIEIFIDQNGYVKVVQGLQNTVPYCDCRSGHRYFDRDCYRDGQGCCRNIKCSQEFERYMQRLCGDVQRNADGCAASCILFMYFFRSSDGT